MSEEAAFLATIRERPDDDGPRLIFADFLDERGDPRGAFIRIQCALARMSVDDPRRAELTDREQALLDANRSRWAAPFRGLASVTAIRRGFVEDVNIEARVFLLRAGELFELAPIRHVNLLDVAGLIPHVADCEYLRRLSELTIGKQHLGDRLARALADSRNVSELKALRLHRNRLGDGGAAALAGSPHLANLKVLELGENGIGDLGARAIAASTRLARLEKLELPINEIGFGGLQALAASASLPALTSLGLGQNRIGTQRGYPFKGEAPPRLLSLDLSDNGVNSASIVDVIGLPYLGRLDRLDLNRNQLSNIGVETLCGSEIVRSLSALHLSYNQIGDDGARSLARCEHLEQLAELDLSHNPIHDTGALALLQARTLRKLRRLGVPNLGLSQRMKRRLQARFGPPL
jgi:uncharacterized protein (TIGR02996 family)